MVQASLDSNVDPKSLQKNSSIATVFSLINQMVGGTMLVLPLLFSTNGVIGGAINLIITGVISCKANMIYVDHLKLKEMDFQQSILRILGKNYELLFKIVKWLYLFFIIMIYFTLITLQLYSVIEFGLASADVSEDYYVPVTEENQFQFGKFNVPYMTIFTFFLCLALVSIEEITFLVKIASYGVSTIISFCIFIVSIFFYSMFYKGLDHFTSGIKDITLFSADVGELAGTAAMAFAVQINSCSAVKCNKNQENNQRDIIATYISGGLIYEMIGILGSLAVTSMDCDVEKAATITDCFSDTNVATLIVILIYVAHLISAFPIYYNLARDALIQLFWKGVKPSKKTLTIINISQLLLFCVIQNIPKVKPDDLMSLNGAVCCFFYVYQIPLMMDIQCYHGKNRLMGGIKRSLSRIGLIQGDRPTRVKSELAEVLNQENNNQSDNEGEKQIHGNLQFDENDIKESLMSQQQKDPVANNHLITIEQRGSIDYDDSKRIIESQDDHDSNPSGFRRESCNFHDYDPRYKTARIVTYTLFWLVGVAVLFYEIYLVIKTLVNKL